MDRFYLVVADDPQRRKRQMRLTRRLLRNRFGAFTAAATAFPANGG